MRIGRVRRTVGSALLRPAQSNVTGERRSLRVMSTGRQCQRRIRLPGYSLCDSEDEVATPSVDRHFTSQPKESTRALCPIPS